MKYVHQRYPHETAIGLHRQTLKFTSVFEDGEISFFYQDSQ